MLLDVLGFMVLSPTRVSTIHTKVGAGHVRARCAEEEYRRASEVFRFAELAQHVLRWPIDSALGVALEELFYHGGDYIAW